jgi:hypothetical protein
VIPVANGAACPFEDVASSGGWGVNIGPVAAVGHGEYAGGGWFEGTACLDDQGVGLLLTGW